MIEVYTKVIITDETIRRTQTRKEEPKNTHILGKNPRKGGSPLMEKRTRTKERSFMPLE